MSSFMFVRTYFPEKNRSYRESSRTDIIQYLEKADPISYSSRISCFFSLIYNLKHNNSVL